MTRVSVITPCHQAAAYIDEMLDSVTAQTLTDWEHVVVDDGSPDDSADRVMRRLELEPRLRLVRQANSGAIAARNRGFDVSDRTTEYLLFLDAD
ncbi:MAG TPA: glycosyltransferase family A protein, partial [Candidatus Dormibacteraeota bacterium]|nr:glycosyltransferase family A protein [Candidatus Dormibacteraeota bacterium]